MINSAIQQIKLNQSIELELCIIPACIGGVGAITGIVLTILAKKNYLGKMASDPTPFLAMSIGCSLVSCISCLCAIKKSWDNTLPSLANKKTIRPSEQVNQDIKKCDHYYEEIQKVIKQETQANPATSIEKVQINKIIEDYQITVSIKPLPLSITREMTLCLEPYVPSSLCSIILSYVTVLEFQTEISSYSASDFDTLISHAPKNSCLTCTVKKELDLFTPRNIDALNDHFSQIDLTLSHRSQCTSHLIYFSKLTSLNLEKLRLDRFTLEFIRNIFAMNPYLSNVTFPPSPGFEESIVIECFKKLHVLKMEIEYIFELSSNALKQTYLNPSSLCLIMGSYLYLDSFKLEKYKSYHKNYLQDFEKFLVPFKNLDSLEIVIEDSYCNRFYLTQEICSIFLQHIHSNTIKHLTFSLKSKREFTFPLHELQLAYLPNLQTLTIGPENSQHFSHPFPEVFPDF